MSGALDGVRVVEVADLLSGQWAGRILADLGAEVVKVEIGPDGDPLRQERDVAHAHLFPVFNAGKQSLALDAADDAGARRVAEIARTADVLIVTALDERAGWLDVGQLERDNPGLVVCSVTPFGLTGPLAGRPASEAMIQAMSGVAYMNGEPGEAPYLAGAGFPHTMAGMHAALATIQALIYRDRTGLGQRLDVAMLDVAFGMDCETNPVVASERGRYRPQPIGRLSFSDTLGLYRGPEGWITVEVWGEGEDSMWGRLAMAMGRQDLLTDPDFATDSARIRNWDRWVEIIQGWLGTFPSDDAALETLTREKVVSGRVLEPWQTLDLPQVKARNIIRTVAAAGGGTTLVPATQYRFSDTPITVGPVPAVGGWEGEAAWRSAGTENAPAAARGDAGASDRPMDGIVVLEMTQAVAGPYGPRLLADLGAEVIKVERPTGGDMMREYAAPGLEPWASFAFTSAGKKSLCVDVTDPRGREVILDLIPHVDVLIQNFTPGTMEKMGLSYDTLRVLNPRLVMSSVSGFGQDGPWRSVRATDPAMQSWTGVASMIGQPGETPYLDRSAPCDTLTATSSAIAVSAALYRRGRTGQGQHLDLSLMDTVFGSDCMTLPAVAASGGTYRPTRSGSIHHAGDSLAVRGPERFLVVQLDGAGSDSGLVRLLRGMGRDDLATDPRFTDPVERVRHGAELTGLVEAWLAACPTEAAALDALSGAGVLASPVLSSSDAVEHPQIAAREMVRDVAYPGGGRFMSIATPLRLSRTPIRVGATPLLGQHNDEVLLGRLGYGQERVDSLREAGLLYEEPDRIIGAPN
ncbi:MAG: hypothetical protein QOH61_2309 [Chloroflexota bacterium]|jgi:crotonobetainyl-CoA:carnitine CoA-transferase CaiB-like acyl-CoA transferase|nr:hypothetical protein [Chloroflexota bacterium]